MTLAELLTDAFGRVLEDGLTVLDGLDADTVAHRPRPDANSIAWLVWHATRVQDDHIADVAGTEQVWIAQGFVDRFDLDLPATDTGFGHDPDEVAKVRAGADLLGEYLTATHEQTVRYLADLQPDDLDRIVDDNWDPPVTLGVRLVSVVNDDTQHIGQAAYLRGLLA